MGARRAYSRETGVYRDCLSVARKEEIGSLLGQPGTLGSAISGEITMQRKIKGLVREMTCLKEI